MHKDAASMLVLAAPLRTDSGHCGLFKSKIGIMVKANSYWRVQSLRNHAWKGLFPPLLKYR
jgi:hypothetical protein